MNAVHDRALPTAVALAALIAILALLASGSWTGSADAAKKRNCGHVTFSNKDSAESGGLVTSKGVKCKRARKMMLKCGKRGKRPSGWRASVHGASLKLSKGNKHVKAQLAGGAPPRMNQCLN